MRDMGRFYLRVSFGARPSAEAYVLRSGRAVLCLILAHSHDNDTFGFEAWY